MAGNANSGRRPGFKMSDEHRQKIANSNVLQCLIEHAEGRREMKASAVTAGLGLLKKILPDVSSVELSGPEGGPVQIDTITIKIIDPKAGANGA